jgi:hypothetical protein
MLHILKPLYLIGLSLAAIPLILHLLGRRRMREQPFSSLFLLKEIKKSSSVWMRVKDLILLILRTLFILSAAFAFSHPLVLSPFPFLGKPAPRDVVMLIDVSMSMGVQGMLERAKHEATELANRLGAESRMVLISFTDRVEKEQEILEESRAIEFIGNLHATCRATDLLPALERAQKILEERDGFVKEIIIVSDFQRSGIQNIDPAVSKITKRGIVMHASFIRGSENNIFFSDWFLEPPFPLKGTKVKLSPKLSSLETPQAIELFVRGIKRGVKKTSPHTQPWFEMQVRTPGYQWGFFRTGGDSLSLDNNYYFSFHAPEFLNVLLVGKGNEYGFVSAALTPGIETPIKLNTSSVSELVRQNLLQYDLIILYNVMLDSAAKVRVMDYLSSGGGVLYILGSGSSSLKGRILDVIDIVKENRTEDAFFSIKTVDEGFPPVAGFGNKVLMNLKEAKIYRYFTLSSPLHPVVVAGNGEPLVLSGMIENGRVVVFAFALDTEWSQLPLKAVFVPLLYRTAFFLAAKQEQLPRYIVGDAIRMPLGEKFQDPVFVLPDGKERSASETENGYVLRNVEGPGIYTFVPQPGESIPLAVNTDPQESNLMKSSFEELKELFPGILISGESRSMPAGKRWLDLFPLFLGISILFLIAELILQNR